MTTNKDSSPSSEPQPAVILVVYMILGSLISFLAGREPGNLPENIPREIGPAVVVICGFIISYSLWDCMAVGTAKARCSNVWKSYKDLPQNSMPEEVYLAVRVQTNQVEQMPVFLVGTIACALLVNGTVAAVLALAWSVLRRMYASAYRNAIGVPFDEIGLGRFTIPCYFLSNCMVMSAAVHSLRAILSG